MQTQITDYFLKTAQGQEADAILRSCVHCGFCTATCPTYQLLGDELDGPRGRIYLIKQILEGQTISRKTQTHLDRCLSCLSCETTCPSGVQYGRLVGIGRELVAKEVKRAPIDQLKRFALRKLLPYPLRFTVLLRTGQWLSPFLPAALKQKVPKRIASRVIASGDNLTQARKMLVLQGCVQSVATPNTHHAAANILQKLGIELVSAEKSGCCGAVSQHLSARDEALVFIRANIDAWWPSIEQGAEAIVINASGCAAMIKEYGYLLRKEPEYADKAAKVSALAKDISEILSTETLDFERIKPAIKHIAFHSPCTLQHSQKLDGIVESLLTRCGFKLSQVDDAHLCCGSAGTYSILQADLAQQLLDNKLHALQKQSAELIVTANIGCQLHLQSQADTPVKHWVELLDDSYR
ncbi:MAG: glycolate oxidase subunit GlcF [Methyloprofundus sp.]|nr:glycolate oxidase subunit GlcF [Methyloprofundus sp.]